MDPMKEAKSSGKDEIVQLLRQALRFAEGGISHARTPTGAKLGSRERMGSSGRRNSVSLINVKTRGERQETKGGSF